MRISAMALSASTSTFLFDSVTFSFFSNTPCRYLEFIDNQKSEENAKKTCLRYSSECGFFGFHNVDEEPPKRRSIAEWNGEGKEEGELPEARTSRTELTQTSNCDYWLMETDSSWD